MFVYIYHLTLRTFVVGHWDPKGNFVAESEHRNQDEAAMRVHWLNGGNVVASERFPLSLN